MNVLAERDALLLRLERERNRDIRAEAAEGLCELAFAAPDADRADFSPVVVQLLSDRQEEVQVAGLALATLVLPPAEARDVLARWVGDPRPRVRVEAVGRLADLALPDARGILAAALEDPALPVRFEAARGMVGLQHSAGLSVLTQALSSPDFRFRAAAALAQLGNPAALPALRQAFTSWFVPAFDRTQLAGALARLGDAEGRAHLFRRLARRNAMDRPMAIELLGEVGAAEARGPLLAVLADRADPGRGAAARALGRLGGEGVQPALLAVLADPASDDDVKLDVCEGLLALGTPSARAAVRGLSLDDPHAREELAELLAGLPVTEPSP